MSSLYIGFSLFKECWPFIALISTSSCSSSCSTFGICSLWNGSYWNSSSNSSLSWRIWGKSSYLLIFSCFKIFFQEVFLFIMLLLKNRSNFFRKLVLNSSTSYFRNLILWMRSTNLISPLHLFCLNDKFSYFSFSVFCWSEWNNKVCSFSINI